MIILYKIIKTFGTHTCSKKKWEGQFNFADTPTPYLSTTFNSQSSSSTGNITYATGVFSRLLRRGNEQSSPKHRFLQSHTNFLSVLNTDTPTWISWRGSWRLSQGHEEGSVSIRISLFHIVILVFFIGVVEQIVPFKQFLLSAAILGIPLIRKTSNNTNRQSYYYDSLAKIQKLSKSFQTICLPVIQKNFCLEINRSRKFVEDKVQWPNIIHH